MGTPAAATAGSAQVGGGEAVRYRTAEMADAMLGSGLPAQQAKGLSVVPGDAKEEQESASTTTGTCEAAAGGSGECEAVSRPSAPLAQPDMQGHEHAVGSPVVLETVLPGTAEEPNSTESVKTPKVACEERNVTGISNFTLQILNVSQVNRPPVLGLCAACLFLQYLTWWISVRYSLSDINKGKNLGEKAVCVILSRNSGEMAQSTSLCVPVSFHVLCISVSGIVNGTYIQYQCLFLALSCNKGCFFN